jgi:hypothetical protein
MLIPPVPEQLARPAMRTRNARFNQAAPASATRQALLIGMPMIHAYQTERQAPPFGIFVHESARSFAPGNEVPLSAFRVARNTSKVVGNMRAFLFFSAHFAPFAGD